MSAMLPKRCRADFRLVAAGLLLCASMWLLVPVASAQLPTIEIELGHASGEAGDSVEIPVLLHIPDNAGSTLVVAGIQIDIVAEPPLMIPIKGNGKPDCWRNTELTKDYTVFSFPLRITDDIWNRMRALVLSVTNIDPIPDGSLLFTCRFDIAADAEPGEYQLTALRLLGSTPQGDEIPAVSTGGTVLVADPAEGTASQSVDTMQSSGGCAIEPGDTSRTSWIVLAIPALLLGLWRRRSMPSC